MNKVLATMNGTLTTKLLFSVGLLAALGLGLATSGDALGEQVDSGKMLSRDLSDSARTGADANIRLSDTPTLSDVILLLKQQQVEIESLKRQLKTMDSKVEATASVVERVAAPDSALGKVADIAARTQLGGYGEIHYNNKKNGKTDEVDAHRFVLFVNHQFNDKVSFFSELELEHSESGEGKEGEVELEQAFIEWDYADHHAARFGQFLVPIGIINETHEPDSFYGVERNPVEKNIIPSTWWESGVMLNGEIAAGFSYDIGVHSGFETDYEGDKAFNIRSGRQKVSKATAEDFAYTGRLKYTGIAGLELAFAVNYQENLLQGLQPEGTDDASALLYEAHGIYQSGPFALRALYAEWGIDGDEAKVLGADEQKGWYFEPSYKINPRLGVFARYSEWDTHATSISDTEVEQIDFGLNYWLVENVVFKADWSDQRNGNGDSFNLGLGFSF